MKRSASSTTDMMRKFKKTKYTGSSIGTLPKELQTEIFARIAADSCADITSCKLSCKLFKEIAEDGYIYRHVSLDKIPITPWFSSGNQETFLEKCQEFQNPELIYRQAVVDYFSKGNLRSASQYLQKAMNLGHDGAMYLTSIALLFGGDEESKEKGMKLLSSMKKSRYGNRKVRESRNKLMKHLRMIWVENSSMRAQPVCCIAMEENHRMRMGWDINEYDDTIQCEACLADFEIRCICGNNQ